nr:MAG: hypothetical protein 1 [Salisharnavirus sp.]
MSCEQKTLKRTRAQIRKQKKQEEIRRIEEEIERELEKFASVPIDNEDDWVTITRQMRNKCQISDPSSKVVESIDREELIEDQILLDSIQWKSEGLTSGARYNFKESKKRDNKKSKIEPHAEEEEDLLSTAASVEEQTRDENDEELQHLLDSIPDVSDHCEDLDDWVSALENVVIMAYQVSKARSFTEVFVAIIAYIKMHTRKSIVKSIVDLVNEVSSFEAEPDVIEPHAWNGESVLRNWNLLKTNTVFTKISFLITAAMSMSVCEMKQIDFSIFGLKLCSFEAAKQQIAAVDVIDAAIKTFTWVAEVGYQVYVEKSLAPLLYSDQNMRKFNDECDYVLAHSETVINGNGEDLNDFEYRVDRVLEQVVNLKKARDAALTSSWIQDRYSKLVHIKEQIVCKRRNTAIRFAPFGVGLTGSSGVGKSTLSKLVMKVALYAMGFDPDPNRIITKDMFDQYDSTYTSDILGMFMDDVGNGKSQFAKVSPTDVIIKFFNNMAAQAVKAELNSKGVVFIDFKVGVISSNFRDYGVRCYTDKPEATLRRFIHTRVEIKDHFRKPGGVSLNTDHPDLESGDLTQDVWKLTLEECKIYEGKNGNDKHDFEIMTVKVDGEDIHCKDLDLRTYLSVIATLAKKHSNNQRRVIERSKQFDDMEMDPVTCLPKSLSPHSFDLIEGIVKQSATNAFNAYVDRWLQPVNLLNWLMGYSPIQKMATKRLSSEMYQIINETATPMLIAMTPEFMFRSRIFQRAIDAWQRSAAMYDLKDNAKRCSRIYLIVCLIALWYGNFSLLSWTLFFAWITSMLFWSQYRARVRIYKREFLERRDILPESVKEIRDRYVVKGAFVVGTLVVGLKLFRMWNDSRKDKFEANAASDVDGQPGWLDFLIPRMKFNVERQEPIKRAVEEHARGMLEKNHFWADFERDDGSKAGCNIFMRRKSEAWFPLHMFYKDSNMANRPSKFLKVTVYRSTNVGGIFDFVAEMDTVATLPELDMVAAYVPNGPDLPDISKWLPLGKPTGNGVCVIRRRYKQDAEFRNVHVKFQQEGHSHMTFYGGRYHTSLAQKGSCMAPLITSGNAPVIAGFHIGGDARKNIGVMQTVTLEQADRLQMQLESFPGVILSAQATELPITQYDKPVVSGPVHPKAVFNEMEAEAYVDVLGSTEVRKQQKSSVQQSVISDVVTEVTGVPNTWGPPKLLPNWRGYNATLEHIVNPADMFLPSALERARQDWLRPLWKCMDEHVTVEDFRPLNEHEMVMGIAGKSFLNALPMNTGMGFPVFGKKRKHFEESEVDGVLFRTPSDEIQNEMNRMVECWRRGERAYPVTTATLKDEPTSVDKDKVRVFQASTVAMSLMIRKYFLPIARFLGCYTLESECAVGVNAHSKNWKKLMDHANKYATDGKVIAWDYSKYDVRMNSQVTRAVWCSFIELAAHGGYDEESIYIMKMMIADIVHPLIDYNGTMIMAYNMNTSGNNLTVNVNSTAGSFYVRMGFFNEYPNVKDFRSCVAALTYGDDFVGSVSEAYRERFGFLSFQKFLAAHDMKVTLPDKSDNAVDFLDDKDADFLKRQSQFIPEIGTCIGKLSEGSIFKSLHSNLKSSSSSMRDVSMSCLEGAMNDWFAHGREVYDMRRAQMIEVCERMDLPVPNVYATFDDRVDAWKQKYDRET